MVAFYKHNIPDWMDGTEKLSDGAYRAYHVIVQLIYLNEGPIALNEHGIAGRCKQSVRAFRTHLEELSRSKKVRIEDGRIHNSRAEKELEKIGENRENARTGGENSGKSRNSLSKALKNNEAGQAPLPHDRSLKDKTRQEERREDSDSSSESIAARETRDSSAPAAALDFDKIEAAVHEALPKDVTWKVRGDQDISPICQAMKDGADLNLDVVPAIRDTAKNAQTGKRTVNRWSYFAQAIRDRHKARMSASASSGIKNFDPHTASDARSRQDAMLKAWLSSPKHNRTWATEWGPAPDKPGCRIPDEVLRAHGIEPVKAKEPAS